MEIFSVLSNDVTVTQARGDETVLKEEGGCERITAIAGEERV